MPKRISDEIWTWYFYAAVFAVLFQLFVYACFRFYRNLWSYTSLEDIIRVVIANTLIFIGIYIYDYYVLSHMELMVLPRRLLALSWTINMILFAVSRFGYRLIKRFFIVIGHWVTRKAGSKRVMVIGAGSTGYGVIRHILNNAKSYEDRVPIIVVDDDPKKNDTTIHGIRVVKGTDNIPELAKMYAIEEIIVAVPSATNIQLKKIMDKCSETECSLKVVPPLSDVSDGVHHILRDVKITDLLFRDEIDIDVKSISGYLKDKIVLVTGGGGSIGSEICRQISVFSPNTLIIFDIYENNAFDLANELKSKYGNINIIVRIGSVRDKKRVAAIFEEFRPTVIFHAAAHKHVTLMQDCPGEAVKNNVFGTLNVAECADEYKAERFVLLSTDKAVNPTNVMGATKRVTELVIQEMAKKSKTKFMAVRFGNVLGSNGSVIPTFQRQISEGGPVTVTHPDIVRYFMTIPEASKLVLQAAGLGRSGKIFVLDMGEPVKINDLARNLIKLSGFVPDKDIKIVYTGLRPGEKLYEELIMAEEKEDMQVTYHNKIFVTKAVEHDSALFAKQLESLKYAAENKPMDVYRILKEILPNFNNAENISN
ncbi:MAG: polysaccharide biosynthesis protein [Firmicutes bacterium]|nr:polysaccharide biosynthesis protein [Bacillota bacterium]